MISEDYVSFETAELLKEKGFNDVPVYTYYLSYGGFYMSPMAVTNKNLYAQGHIAAPTLQMAIKWLREVHNLFIFISTWLRHKDGTVQYYYEIRNLNDKDFETIAESTITEFDSLEKTCEAAIKYCLENLI